MDMSNDERYYRQDLRNTYYWQPERRVSIQYQRAQQSQPKSGAAVVSDAATAATNQLAYRKHGQVQTPEEWAQMFLRPTQQTQQNRKR
ncbi:hypothetical protein AGMMS49936_01490 [Endomicrobiia bacterium]|nr:hypothetical protein AGMMS49936_01490 [Endomicrobiia bacterium]